MVMIKGKQLDVRSVSELISHIADKAKSQELYTIIYDSDWPEIAYDKFRNRFKLEFEKTYENEYKFSPPDIYDSWTLHVHLTKSRPDHANT